MSKNMTDEEKKAAETAKAEAEKAAKEKADAEFEASLDGLSDEEKEQAKADREADESSSKKIDYKAEAERERKAREEAEKKLQDTRDAARKAADDRRRKREEDGDEGDDDEDKPLTRAEMDARLEKERETTEKRVNEDRALEIVNDLASSPEQAEYAMEIFKSYSFPAHLSLRDKVESAFALANRKALVGERNEAMRSLKNRGNAKNNDAQSHRGAADGIEPKLSAPDKSALTAAGFTFNTTSRRYEKKISNGGLIYRDPKNPSITRYQPAPRK